MAESVYSCGSVVRVSPTIYKTVDGQVIVEDEFLNFLSVKMKTMTADEIVLAASNTFDSNWIESSRKVLFELCPEQRCGAKGIQNDANNIKSCLKVLNECGEDIPRFVSHYLDALPPVTSGNHSNLDVSYLLSKIECLHSEVCALRRAGEVQAEIGEDLRTAVATMDSRVAAVEGRLRTDGDPTSVAPVAAAKPASPSMDINLKMLDGTSLVLRVPHEDTVGSLKKLIQKILGVATQRQNLFFEHYKLECYLIDDTKPVSFYGLESGSRVSLRVTDPATIKVFLKNPRGQLHAYDITPDENVSNFYSRVEEREKVPVKDHTLIYRKKLMWGGKLSDYNVEPLSTIEMV